MIQKTQLQAVIEDMQEQGDETIDQLRGGQAHLSQLKKRIEKELAEIQDTFPSTRREKIMLELERARKRSSEVGKAMSEAKQRLGLHAALFKRDMPLDTVRTWALEHDELRLEHATLADLWHAAEKYVEICRLQAEEAIREPDERRVKILLRIQSLKNEFDSMNWNAPQTERGEEILFELRELEKQL
jgi:hypothetical protein